MKGLVHYFTPWSAANDTVVNTVVKTRSRVMWAGANHPLTWHKDEVHTPDGPVTCMRCLHRDPRTGYKTDPPVMKGFVRG